ncbi:hypothetical protein BDA99DRAFT_577569 [Phascolomyces articulosus]|uniref:Uncharacterized protein n=1 Tax=Phascolomyces articulosus TaxID=60185 RepID=A0AAD5JV03_9FUNG|nr:hypothetical protein BDA99DRAFT_577569 [Phascolomyces articulosus]
MVWGGGGYDYNQEFRKTHNEEVMSIIMAYYKGSATSCMLDNKELHMQIYMYFTRQRDEFQCPNEDKVHVAIREALLCMECISPKVSDNDSTDIYYPYMFLGVLQKQKLSFYNTEVDDYFQMLDTLESRGKKEKGNPQLFLWKGI